jgi:hypothetical protein
MEFVREKKKEREKEINYKESNMSDNENIQKENAENRKRTHNMISDEASRSESSSESDDESENEGEYAYDDFVRPDNDGSGSEKGNDEDGDSDDDDEDEDETSRKRSLKRLKKASRQKIRSDEEDEILINEANKELNLSSTSGEKKEEEEDVEDEIPKIKMSQDDFDDGEEGSDGFIVDDLDDENEGHIEREERTPSRYPRRRVDATFDQLQDAIEIFGQDYLDEEQEQEEYPDQFRLGGAVEEIKNTDEMKLKGKFERATMVSMFCTENDDWIRKMDQPERLLETLKGREAPDDNERKIETEWIVDQMIKFQITRTTFFNGGESVSLWRDAIKHVLKFIQVQQTE